MSNQGQPSPKIFLPPLPAIHADWISHATSHPDTPLCDLIAPYKEYDSKLREVFAQQPDHSAIAKPNIVPIFAGHEQDLKIRARNFAAESEAERQCYLMPLKKWDRKTNGTPAVVQSLKEFQTNFQLFSESSLVDMDWSNVVVAGSAVVTSLLPVPEKHNGSKRALREYYHQQLAPASDVDLFLYDLTEEEAVEKIKQIEQRIRDSILTETTTVRTKNAITIASQYPTRHVQIVLRIYRSISEILTGFDVDCSCAAYDGSQVYASPRALAAYMTQINTIDLTRRSPSYENRLSKYSHRGFEIYWPLLDRSRIDPTIFERSFGRTLGLSRLLVLEKLPSNTDREAYVDQRRAERGRPAINRWGGRGFTGNMKEEHDDEVAEWVETDEVSDYHTFTIPYGPKYHARKIERLLYAKDLLLNAEWNRPKERETTLHRHPAFFGNATDVIGDCCGYCPEPITPEDKEIAEEENKVYVSGSLSFIRDNPGRQAIGSFNPLTEDDWTEMAYVGNTARLCQAIVEGDLEHVQDWLRQEGADPNQRDYTGRTPLQLAVMTSTPEIVQSLIDGGARIVARLVDGKTALHLAAMRGETSMVKALLVKSEANEEREAEKEALKKGVSKPTGNNDENMADVETAVDNDSETVTKHQGSIQDSENAEDDEDDDSEKDSDIDMLDDDSENNDATTENSIVKISRRNSVDTHDAMLDNTDDEPDVYDVNVLAWDAPVSALHLAIANGHTDVVKMLVQEFGADVLLPIKLVHDFNKSARAAILPIVLSLQLPQEKAKEMTELLIGLGASPAQADVEHVTALQYFTAHGVELLATMVSANQPAAQRALGHISMTNGQFNRDNMDILNTAILNRDEAAVGALLELGAKPEIDFGTYMTSLKSKWDARGSSEDNEKNFRQTFTQPIFSAVSTEMPSVVLKLLDAGANMNSLTATAWGAVHMRRSYGDNNIHTLLDAVRQKVEDMREFLQTGKVPHGNGGYMFSYNRGKRFPPIVPKDDSEYLQDYDPESYAHWQLTVQISNAKKRYDQELESYNQWVASSKEPKGTEEKKAAIRSLLSEFEVLESQLLQRGAKTFKDIHPDITLQARPSYDYGGYEPEPPKPWNPMLSFQLPDLNDERRAAYVRLFQACWVADLSTVKELTLAVWGDNQSPLKIAVQDMAGFSPFSIAILRKHSDVARAVLEIAHAQFAPEEKVGTVKHSIQATNDDDDSDRDDADVQIYSEILDDRFTVENIGEVQNQVKSNITPLTLVLWTCPAHHFLGGEGTSQSSPQRTHSLFDYQQQLQGLWRHPIHRYGHSRNYRSSGRSPRQVLKHAANGRSYPVRSQIAQENIPEVDKPMNLFQFAIFLNDSELLHFLIAMGEDASRRKMGGDDDAAPRFFSFEEADFLYAIRLARTELLKEIITRTGCGIPLDDLVKRSGVKMVEKPKQYQGLSVHGQKREDWANAGREVQSQQVGAQHPPLLHAARSGSLDSVEWFSSDAVLRCYLQFTDDHRGDIRIQNLAKMKGGVEVAISKWLNLRSHLLLHCVVLGKTREESLDSLRYLCKRYPEALEHRSANGMTPLHLAFRLYRVDMIPILLEAGAQQTCRNNVGANIVHSILESAFLPDDKKLDRIRKLFGLVDPRLIASLLTERTTEAPGAATPLARWMHSFRPQYSSSVAEGHDRVLKVILDFSKGEDLGIISGEGDTPVHVAARYGAHTVLRTMLDCRPDLLFRENATGRTPYEIAEDSYLSKEVFNNPPSLSPTNEIHYSNNRRRQSRRHRSVYTGGVLQKRVEEFAEEPKDDTPDVEKALGVCREFATKAEGAKRKLVSLVEASEVARRLAAMQVGDDDEDDTDEEVNNDGEEEDEEEEGEEQEQETGMRCDEVEVWFAMGEGADL
ncbi:Ankyrin repeat protein [Pyrenophora teres f. maculata]|nr:Ankyrin repeat protein [Pyrenophora teres f. maculata]